MPRAVFLIFCLLFATAALSKGNVASTKHNLSISGPGDIKSSTETRICVFCHTPHLARTEAALWNRPSTGFTNYQSSTIEAVETDSQYASAICLSCHDGTIALGDMLSKKRGNSQNALDLSNRFLKGRSNLESDLSNDHPVAIYYDEDLAMADPGLNDPEVVDLPMHNNELQCSSCHDPHSDMIPPFLHKTTLNGELCVECHMPSGLNWSWETSSHAISEQEPRGMNPWPERKPEWAGRNVRENACMNCHATHNAANSVRLVSGKEEENCNKCHNGSVTNRNIQADGNKFFRHPVERSSGNLHEAANKENPMTMRLHVECEDCHNPHAVRSEPPMISFNPASPMDSNHATPPFVNGSMLGVSGIDAFGSKRDYVDFEYEVCFKCHGVPGKSACENERCSTATGYNMSRLDNIYNIRDKFNPNNSALRSYHPVVDNNPNNNSEVPSLRLDTPLNSTESHIYCGDCHNSDSSDAAGRSGANGSHGSRHEGILALNYELKSETTGSSASAELCFKCHLSSSLYSNESFPHREHVLDNRKSCVNCHDPHGSTSPHLINFLTSSTASGELRTITGAGAYSTPTWQDNGRFSGTCYLNCHGVEHDGLSYPVSASINFR